MVNYQSFRISAVIFFFLAFIPEFSANGTDSPTGLSINFLTGADQVFLNGYPANTLLDQALPGHENYEMALIAQKRPFFGWVVNSRRRIVPSNGLPDPGSF